MLTKITNTTLRAEITTLGLALFARAGLYIFMYHIIYIYSQLLINSWHPQMKHINELNVQINHRLN